MVFKFIPLFAILRRSSIICRSFRCSPLIFTDCLLLARVWRSLSWLMKWWMEGMASLRWTNWHMFCSISIAVEDSSSIIFLIDIFHTLDLLSGSWMRSRQKSMNHPKMVFCSSSKASEWSLFLASIVSRGMGSFELRGLEHMLNARRDAQLHLSKLSVPLMSTASEIKSSMSTSVVPCGLTGMSTNNLSPGLNGMELSRKTGGGTKNCVFSKSCLDCHLSFYLILLIRSHIVSKTMPHSNGLGALLNVRWRLIKAKSSSGIWVMDFTAVSWWRCIWQYADLTLSFLARIFLLRNFLLDATAQFISLDSYCPNLHCWMRLVLILELTLMPKEDHLKLWSCVSLSISIISPLLFKVHWAWIFNGAIQRLDVL